jgi:hypothetical protein
MVLSVIFFLAMDVYVVVVLGVELVLFALLELGLL